VCVAQVSLTPLRGAIAVFLPPPPLQGLPAAPSISARRAVPCSAMQ